MVNIAGDRPMQSFNHSSKNIKGIQNQPKAIIQVSKTNSVILYVVVFIWMKVLARFDIGYKKIYKTRLIYL